MSSLDELFPSGDRASANVAPDGGRLDAVVGEPMTVSTPIDHDAELLRLQRMVGSAGAVTLVGDARAVATLPTAAATRTKARSRFLRKQRRDWLPVVASIAAVAAVAIAGALGVKTAMASTPTDDSRSLLANSEEALSSTISVVNAERARLETLITDTLTQSEHAATSLAAMTGVVDDSSRVLLVNALGAYVTSVRAVKVPAALQSFTSTPLSPTATLSEIGAVLEAVDARQAEVDAAQAELRDLHKSVTAQRDAFAASVKPLADSMIVLAGSEIALRAAAIPEFRAAVQTAANALAAARTTGRMGWVEMQALGEAIRALRAADERARAEAEAESDNGSSGGGGQSSPSDSGGAGAPPPEQSDPPAPVDPPVDPVDPPVDPADPPVDGGA